MSQYFCHIIRFQNIHHQELGSCISEAMTQAVTFSSKDFGKIYTHTEILHLPLVPSPAYWGKQYFVSRDILKPFYGKTIMPSIVLIFS